MINRIDGDGPPYILFERGERLRQIQRETDKWRREVDR